MKNVKKANKNLINKDCRYFHGNRPCIYHKLNGIVCRDCSNYDPVMEKILIIKLAADGDVLRTTCLLPALKEKYLDSQITWITQKSATHLLENNTLIDRVWSPPEHFIPFILAEKFELIINPDADPLCCAIASIAKGKDKYGFVLDDAGRPEPLSKAAENWFRAGVRDDIKRANRKLYQEVIYNIAGLNPPIHKPVLSLRNDEVADAERYLASCGWKKKGCFVVGINTGAGARWPRKALPIDTLSDVIDSMLKIKPEIDIFLLGGPEEKEKNRSLGERFNRKVILTGTDNSIRRFAGIIYHVDILLTADSLPMHIGIALNKYIIAHFGPTSPWEIGLYDYGEKIFPDMDCISCYLSECNINPACNEMINSEELVSAVKRGIERVHKGGQLF